MVADTPWIKCLIITRLNFGSTVLVGPPINLKATCERVAFFINSVVNGAIQIIRYKYMFMG